MHKLFHPNAQMYAMRFGFVSTANRLPSLQTDSAKHTDAVNGQMFIFCHNKAVVILYDAVKIGGSAAIAYSDEGSAKKRAAAAKQTLPAWLLPGFTTQAPEASNRPGIVVFMPNPTAPPGLPR